MNWRAKAFLGRALSVLPGHSRLHYLVQRHVMRSLPMPEPDFRIRVEAAGWHLANYRRHARQPLAEATFLEFGAGWDLVIPLVFASAGVGHQILLDRAPLVRVELVDSSLVRLRALAAADARRAGPALPDLPQLPASGPRRGHLASWLAALGIEYLAPADARATGLPEGACDAVTNTATLEHIPEAAVAQIMREMFRVLRPGGLLSCEIDLSDHFSHSDPSISPWHFLRYSDTAWRWLNSDLLYQNRLRASTHVAMVEAAGFEVVLREAGFPPGLDLSRMAGPPVHPTDVRSTDRSDLLATSIRLLARKPPA